MLLDSIWLIVLGVLAVPNLIIGKKPEAKQYLDKITPYQGWIGAVSALWGLWETIQALLHIKYLSVVPVLWITWLAYGVVQLALGLLLGIGTLKTFIKAPAAQQKMDLLVAKLAPKQGMLGIAAIGVGIWLLVAGLFIWHM